MGTQRTPAASSRCPGGGVPEAGGADDLVVGGQGTATGSATWPVTPVTTMVLPRSSTGGMGGLLWALGIGPGGPSGSILDDGGPEAPGPDRQGVARPPGIRARAGASRPRAGSGDRPADPGPEVRPTMRRSLLWTSPLSVGHTGCSACSRREAAFSQVTDVLPRRTDQ